MEIEKRKDYSLFFAWIVAFVATTGSLYFSEILLYEPCKLCWYQRILMYPLVLLLGTAIVKKDSNIIPYALSLAIPGALVSLYHISIQKIDALSDSVGACGRIPCNIDYLNWFGFITIPMLCFVAFSLIIITLLLLKKEIH